MMAVSVTTDQRFTAGKSTQLFDGPYAHDYDVTPDGRFVMIRTEEVQGTTQINVVLNWAEEVKRLAPTDN